MAERVLVVAPHPDDEAIGCGGAMCLHRGRGDPVRVVFLTSGERGLPGRPPEEVRTVREAEARAAAAVLGVGGVDFLRLPDLGLAADLGRGAEALARVLAACAPDLVYLPHPGESHPDHAAALPLVRAALAGLGASASRSTGVSPVGSDTGGTPVLRAGCCSSIGVPPPELRGYEVWSPMTRFGWVEEISDVMARKLRAVRCYRSQLAVFRYDRAVQGLNRYRGVLGAGGRYAEAFAWLGPRLPGALPGSPG